MRDSKTSIAIKEIVKEKINLVKCKNCEPLTVEFLCPVCELPCCCEGFYLLHCRKKLCFKILRKALYKLIVNNNQAPLDDESNHFLREYQLVVDNLFPEPAVPLTNDFMKMLALVKKIDSLKVYNEESLLNELTEEEREYYFTLKQDLDLKSTKQYVPFWIKIAEEASEQDEDKESEESQSQTDYCQQYLLKHVPPLLEITKVVPTFLSLTSLINILAVYTILCRHYKGQHIFPYAMETTTQLVNISGVFITRKYYLTKKSAIEEACNTSQDSPFIRVDYIDKESVEKDVFSIMSGPDNDKKLFILCTLGQISHMFKECYNNTRERNLNKEKHNLPDAPFRTASYIRPPSLETLTDCFKIIHFYYSYVLSYYTESWPDMDEVPQSNFLRN